MKILNFGSLNIDLVYSTPHFVAPGETLSSIKREQFCGGKGLNQSVALAKAGANTYHAGFVGNDAQMLLDALTS
ncbi:MAG: PfkB family carbohydrate kinase, partial [Clostridia bacterium]|nr:PfkB family carbohydrate kinase [Clostridia bacterium]